MIVTTFALRNPLPVRVPRVPLPPNRYYNDDQNPPADSIGLRDNRKRPVNPILIGYRVVGNLLIDPIPQIPGWHETLQTYGGTAVSADRAV